MSKTDHRPLRGLHMAGVRSRRRLGPQKASLSPSELEVLIRKTRDLPDLRWEKVQAVRAALQSGEYDVDGRLRELLGNMSQAMSPREAP